eukprot:COSAG03_NODE_1114_length_4788_cov_9.163574_6_plen_96_part_00
MGANCEEMSPETEGLEALRSLIGGTYKTGALDRMWGSVRKAGQQPPRTPLMVAAAVGWVRRHYHLAAARAWRTCDNAPWSAGGRRGCHTVPRRHG